MIGIFITELEEDNKSFMINLYKNYYSLVRKTVFSITHDNKDIEDLIDDVFIKLIEKIVLIRTFECYKTITYIIYTSRSIALNYIKHKKVEYKHMYLYENIEGFSQYEDDLLERIIHQEEIELLSFAISKLPQQQKDLLYFKYFLEMSDDEIANLFGIAQNSVRQYLTRARRSAKKIMEKEMNNFA